MKILETIVDEVRQHTEARRDEVTFQKVLDALEEMRKRAPRVVASPPLAERLRRNEHRLPYGVKVEENRWLPPNTAFIVPPESGNVSVIKLV